MKKGILVTGSLALDTIHTEHGSAERVCGGSVVYFSHAARFFTPVSLVAVAGSDFPKPFLEEMGQRDIDVSHVTILEGEKSFFWEGSYVDDMNEAKTLDTQLGVFAEFNPQLTEKQREYDMLFLANIDPALQLSVIEQSGASLIGADSMNLWINHKRDQLLHVISRTDILFLNETEGKLLTGKKRLYDIGDGIVKMGPKAAVIKLGSYGAALFFEDTFLQVPIFPTRDVIDPTGAGDSFAGGFMGYLNASGNTMDMPTLKKAMAVGTVTASFCIEGFSLSIMTSLTKEMVMKRAHSFTSTLNFHL